MKKYLLTGLLLFLILPNITQGYDPLAGKILLQVEDKGQAWYVRPDYLTRYFLGSPNNAFQIIKVLGKGISNNDLTKIPIGISNKNCTDSDLDGVCDSLEDAIGTNKNNKDSDNDGYNDKKELDSGYDPLGNNKQMIDKIFTQKNTGKIFLQVEKRGEAWYVEPLTLKRYFLGRPADAFQIMRNFGLGIKNSELEKIAIGLWPLINIKPVPQNPVATSTEDVIQSAAAAIRSANLQKALSYFTLNMHKSIEYSMQNMKKENLLLLSNILSGSRLQSTTKDKKTYFNEVYFQDKKHPVYFYVKKQPDGNWLIENL
jgi:uncharacterized protein YcgL (UPF0745 family)